MFEIMEDQKVANKIFSNAIKNNKLSHAYIIETNKYKNSDQFVLNVIKNILAIESDAQNCENLIIANSHPDFKILTTDNLQFKKNELISLKSEFKTKPVMGKYKIYLIKDANKLNVNLSNSLLKFVEEPEEGVIAFFMVENRFQILETILSRCQVVSLKQTVLNQTINEYYNFYNYSNENINEELKDLVSFVVSIERNKKNTILYENKFVLDKFKTKEEIKKALELIKLIYIDVLKIKNKIKISYFVEFNKLLEIVSDINTNEKIVKKINILIKNIEKLNYNVNINLFLDKIIIELGDV